MEATRVWILMFLMISLLHANHGFRCKQIVDNIVGILDNEFVHLFPKDYRVQLRVDLTDLNKPSLCIWTSLSLLTGDWLALHQQLWQDQQNFRKTNWLIKGLEELNKTGWSGSGTGEVGLEARCGKKPVALLVNMTLKALHIVRNSNCAPCGTSAPHSLTARSPTTAPTTPWAAEQVAEYATKLETVPHSVSPTFALKSHCDLVIMRILWKSLKQADYPMSQSTLTQLCQSSAERMNQRMALAESSRRTDKEVVSI
ncbi:uncharacterized protein LOC144490448 [Mustelus asterias]